MPSDDILSSSDIKFVKEKIDGEMALAYDDALFKQKNIQLKSIPMWYWVVLVFCAYDQVWSML